MPNDTYDCECPIDTECDHSRGGFTCKEAASVTLWTLDGDEVSACADCETEMVGTGRYTDVEP